ncbi:MAG: hypothetical protein KBA75_08720 [Alphaproteobacteria bacterium]|nr:hypothetical protein [Alphaproteobacteria bacterium]
MFIEQQILISLPREEPQRPPQQQQHPAETCPVRRQLEATRRLQAQQMQCDL